MRERSTDSGSLTENEHHWRMYYTGSSSPSVDVQTFSGERYHKDIADLVTPGFSALKRCGEFLPINPLIVQETTETRLPSVGKFTTSTLEWRGEHYGPYPWTLTIPPWNDSLSDQVALTAAAKAASGEFDALTYMAEFGKTVEHIAHTGKRLNAFTRDLARRAVRYSTTIRGIKRRFVERGPWAIFQDLWLEGRFAWRPMIYDVENAKKAFERFDKGFKLIKGTGFIGEDLADSYDSGLMQVDPQIDKRVVETLEGTRIYRSNAWVDYPNVLSATISADPLSTAWELVPYSFVVDYFIDVGAWVQTVLPRVSGRYRGHSGSVKTEYTLTQEVHSLGKNGATYNASPTKTVIRYRGYQRFPTGVPFPPLLPNLGVAEVTDIAALAIRGKRDVFNILNQRLRR